jgi:hypothetical protein
MSATIEAKPLIRAGIAILGAWLLTIAVMLVAFYDYLPRQAGMTVFRFSASCVFPYDHFTLSENTKTVLTITHWTASITLFTFFGRHLPARWAFAVALLIIPLLAFVGLGALRVIGFP